jgi:hypothetical protein
VKAACLALTVTLLVGACTTGDFTPPPSVSVALVAIARGDGATAQKLAEGRAVFVSRCLECHTLPPAGKYSRDEWPHLVARMAARANLSPSDQEAVTAYLRAASLYANGQD